MNVERLEWCARGLVALVIACTVWMARALEPVAAGPALMIAKAVPAQPQMPASGPGR